MFNNYLECLRMSTGKIVTKLANRKNNYEAGTHGSHYFFKEDRCRSNICLVAHIDTVFDNEEEMRKEFLLGADDRTGVYSVLKIRELTGCAVLLCNFGERGGGGALFAVDCFNSGFYEKPTFFMELDRKGRDEVVFYNNEPAKFKNYIKNSLNLREERGSFSDVLILGRDLKIPSCNISAGFDFEHTKYERVYLDYMEENIKRVSEFIKKEAYETF